MIEWRIGVIEHITYADEHIQEAEVRLEDGSTGRAIHYTDDQQRLVDQDCVLLNTTAVSLQLGSGGFHFVHAVLPKAGAALRQEPDRNNNRPGHIMKLRYTSLQRAVEAVEEPNSMHHGKFIDKQSLNGLPVLIGELHSMLPAAVCRIRQLAYKHNRPCRIVYIMTDGASLPMAFSRHTAELCKLGWLAGTVTYGHAYGGDVETVNKYTALLAAKYVLNAHLVIVTMGPGSVGTGTKLGFSGTEAGELINAVGALGGTPILIPRISFADLRQRHYGISHHTFTILEEIARISTRVVLPILEGQQQLRLKEQIEQTAAARNHNLGWKAPMSITEWEAAIAAYPLVISTMGRGLHTDPAYFAGIGTAVDAAWDYLHLGHC
jgi:hypothetical protein